jgi:hypothetical protein
VALINEAIGAESAIALQCKAMVEEYLPQIVDLINSVPTDQVGGGGGGRPGARCSSRAGLVPTCARWECSMPALLLLHTHPAPRLPQNSQPPFPPFPLPQVCASVGLCTLSRKLLHPFAPSGPAAPAAGAKPWRAAMEAAAARGTRDGMACEFCQAAVTYAKAALASNETMAQIEDAVGGAAPPGGCWDLEPSVALHRRAAAGRGALQQPAPAAT